MQECESQGANALFDNLRATVAKAKEGNTYGEDCPCHTSRSVLGDAGPSTQGYSARCGAAGLLHVLTVC